MPGELLFAFLKQNPGVFQVFFTAQQTLAQ